MYVFINTILVIIHKANFNQNYPNIYANINYFPFKSLLIEFPSNQTKCHLKC